MVTLLCWGQEPCLLPPRCAWIRVPLHLLTAVSQQTCAGWDGGPAVRFLQPCSCRQPPAPPTLDAADRWPGIPLTWASWLFLESEQSRRCRPGLWVPLTSLPLPGPSGWCDPVGRGPGGGVCWYPVTPSTAHAGCAHAGCVRIEHVCGCDGDAGARLRGPCCWGLRREGPSQSPVFVAPGL